MTKGKSKSAATIFFTKEAFFYISIESLLCTEIGIFAALYRDLYAIIALFIQFPVGNNLFDRKVRAVVFNKTGKGAKKFIVSCPA